MIYTLTLNPALDKTVEIPGMTVNTVNRITKMRTDPGGKGINVSKVIKKLGGNSTILALLGGSTGQKIADELNKMGLTCCMTFISGETRTNLKIVDPVLHTNTDINEPGIEVNESILNNMLSELIGKIRQGDIVAISGSLPKGAPKETYFHWVTECKKAGAKVFLDIDGTLLEDGLRACPYLVKPNNDELSRLVGKPLDTIEELVAAAKELLEFGVEIVVVSRGADGALYVTKDVVYKADGLKVPVGSTVGAGDSMVAAMAFAQERELSLEEAVRLSIATGAANVMCSGTQAAEYSVIETLINQVVCYKI